jgi:hypothetical protein
MNQQSVDTKKMGEDLFGDIRVGIDPDQFVARLDKRLDDLILETTERMIGYQPWDTPERQLAACVSQGWGEIRSADTFARQIRKLGTRYPELKLLVAKQLHDEMRHYKMYKDCAIKMAGKDVMAEIPPEPRLMKLFDYFDVVSEDILEEMFVCQFCSEKAALWLFTVSMNKYQIHPDLRTTLEQIIPDEKSHVANGRVATRMLARKGDKTQSRLIGLATEQMIFTYTALEADPGCIVGA